MEQSQFSLFWKEHYKQALILFIRLAEVFMSGIILSLMCVIMIFIKPNQRIWDLMSIICMASFLAVNCRFLLKYIVSRGGRKTEFFVINGITFLAYAGASILAYYFFGYLMFSLVFTNLRVFEIFHIKTLYSIYASNVLIMVVMLVFRFVAYRHMEFMTRVLGVESAPDVTELEKYYTESEAVQNNQSVNIMTVEEMNDAIISEIEEAHKTHLEKLDTIPDKLWSDFKRGDGSEIEYKTPDDPEDDFDENDRVAANNINPHEAYDASELWENEIYNGKEKLEQFEDDDEVIAPPPVEKRSRLKEKKEEIQWYLKSFNKLISIRHNYQRNEVMLRDIRSRARGEVNVNNSYDSETLWNREFYQGGNETAIPEKVLDFDETPENVEIDSQLENYESEKLWDINSKEIVDEYENEETNPESVMNPNEDYDADSLWSTGLKQGRGEVEFSENADFQVESNQNPNEDYDPDSLWNPNLKQGRG